MNAADRKHNLAFLNSLASAITLVRQHFPAAAVNLTPWRDDPETRRWCESETLDFSFHFPGWSPRLQCRSFLVQLRFSAENLEDSPNLIGVMVRGMTFEGERWRLATIGDWEPIGTHLPEPLEMAKLKEICKNLFEIF